MEHAIQVANLVKYYGSNKVIKDVSFNVKQGEVFALLGINGAGKTTILECIEGLRRYAYGRILVNGSLGVQLQIASLPANIKVKEAIHYYSMWNDSKLEDEYIKRLDIKLFWEKQYGELSTGQKRRLHLSLVMLGNPDIIILDEPTAGLDVEGRMVIHQEIVALKQKGKTILLATHDMSEVESLSDTILILKEGEVAFLGSVESLLEENKESYTIMVKYSKEIDGTLVHMYSTKLIEESLKEILKIAEENNCSILDVHVEKKSVAERFLEKSKEIA